MQYRIVTMYYALAVIGLMVTWYFNIQFFISGGSIAPDSFFGSAFANALTTAITVDVYWAALIFSIWIYLERGQPGSPRPWPYIIVCFAIGLAVALPLYLGRRSQLLKLDPTGMAPNSGFDTDAAHRST